MTRLIHSITVILTSFILLVVVVERTNGAFVPTTTTTTTTTKKNVCFGRRRYDADGRLTTTTVRHSALVEDSVGSNVNEMMPLQQGSTCALITPFVPQTHQIDIPTLRSLLRHHLTSQTDGLCILGTTAESSVLTPPERRLILQTAVEEVKGHIPIIVGTGTIDPRKTRDMTMEALDLGCDGCMVVTPYYVKPPQRGLIRYFMDVADLGLPMIVYNVPGRTGVDLSVESLGICALEHEGIVGLKDATGDVGRVSLIREVMEGRRESKFLLLSGDDGTDADFVLGGGDGCISVTANVLPKEKRELMKACLEKKDMGVVEGLKKSMELLNDRLFVESNPIPVKYAMKRVGLIESMYCRPPLDQLDDAFFQELDDALRIAGFDI